MTFPTISAGTRANEPIGGYANFIAYCNALAAGVDSVTTTAAGAALKANNLSDLASASTARTNLGLGTMATASATDYLTKAGNLAGLADLPTARTNLGLGTAAVANTGTGASNVILGNDSRLTDTRTPTDGSVSTAKIVDGAVTDAKLAVKKAPRTALWLPGTSGNSVSCPDSAALSITGDIDLRWYGSLDDWTPATTMALIGKDNGASQRSYFYAIMASGVVRLYISTTGTSWTSVDSTASVPVSDGAAIWVRVTRASATGAVMFYTSTDGATWTQLGSAVSTSAGAIFDSSTALSVGTYDGSSWWLRGRVFRAEVRNGINGTVVASPDFTSPMGPRFRDAQGNLWTVNGSAWGWEQA